MNPKIVVYITLDSLLTDDILVHKSCMSVFKDDELAPYYLKHHNHTAIYDNLVTRLENLRNRKIIESVLLLPFDEETTDRIINPRLLELFNRTYCMTKQYGKPDTKTNVEYTDKEIDSVLDMLAYYKTNIDNTLTYECFNRQDKSPSVLVYHENKELLKHIASYLIDKKLIFSYYMEEGYMKLYINNYYLGLLNEDELNYEELQPDKLLTIYIGCNKEDLDLLGKCSAFILPLFLVEQKINECGFSSVATLISTIKSPLSNNKNLNNYAINAQNELGSFINKIINEK